MPLDGIVAAIRERAVPHNKDWFAYKTSEAGAAGISRRDSAASSAFHSSRRTSRSQPAPSRRSRSLSGLCSTPATRRSTPSRPGSATSRCCSPPTPCRARSALVKPRFDLDLDAIDAAIGPRTRLVIVNTPHNPTGRIYAARGAGGARRAARARVGTDRPANLPAFRRAVPAPAFRRPCLRQPRGRLSVDADIVQLRQGSARAGAAARLSRAVAADAGRRPARPARA